MAKLLTPPPKVNFHTVAFWSALIIHFFGVTGMIFFDREWFVSLTPVNLLIMTFLIWLTHENRSQRFYIFFFICWCTGMAVEIIGVTTGLLFGEYYYGKVLGPGIAGVPFLIGINWFAIVYSSAAVAEKLFPAPVKNIHSVLQTKLEGRDIGISVTGAMLATFFDWVMEPVAVKLGYWEWKQDGSIPVFNYVCWFFVSFFLLICYRLMKLSISNRFAVWLFGIQLIFFILLRLFLPR